MSDRELLEHRVNNIIKHELSGDFDQAAGNATNSIMAYVDSYAKAAQERLLEELETMTKQLWHEGNPTVTIERIESETLSSGLRAIQLKRQALKDKEEK